MKSKKSYYQEMEDDDELMKQFFNTYFRFRPQIVYLTYDEVSQFSYKGTIESRGQSEISENLMLANFEGFQYVLYKVWKPGNEFTSRKYVIIGKTSDLDERKFEKFKLSFAAHTPLEHLLRELLS